MCVCVCVSVYESAGYLCACLADRLTRRDVEVSGLQLAIASASASHSLSPWLLVGRYMASDRFHTATGADISEHIVTHVYPGVRARQCHIGTV